MVSDLRFWALILDRAVHRLVSVSFDGQTLSSRFDTISTVVTMRSDAHLVPLSLRHIDEHLRQLKGSSLWTDQVAALATEFWQEYNSEEIRNLRNLLEHSAEYVAGRGTKRELVEDPDDSWPGMLATDNRLVRITLFGRTYAVRSVITAAIALGKELAGVQPDP